MYAHTTTRRSFLNENDRDTNKNQGPLSPERHFHASFQFRVVNVVDFYVSNFPQFDRDSTSNYVDS